MDPKILDRSDLYPSVGSIPAQTRAMDTTNSRLNDTISKIYNICVPKDPPCSQVTSDQANLVQAWKVSYQTDTPKIVKWIALWLAKIGYNTRYSLHEELIQLERIRKAIPVLEEDSANHTLVRETLNILQDKGGLETLTPPQKMLVAAAAKDWPFLCELGEAEAHFDAGSIKNLLFPPGYRESQLQEVWQSALYDCVLDEDSDPAIFQKLLEIGMKNRYWRVNPGRSFGSGKGLEKTQKNFPTLAYRPQTLLQVAIVKKRADLYKILEQYAQDLSKNELELFISSLKLDQVLQKIVDSLT